MAIKIYFSDFFNVDRKNLDDYGAFDVSLIADLPLFVDPFLLFSSDKDEYKTLHDEIIKYVALLRDVSRQGGISGGLLKGWFTFPEVKQNWFGYSKTGNSGAGLGSKFAQSLNQNLNTVFTNFGTEAITSGSHLEKLCLIKDGVGRDNISDFTTNLIKGYLCEYTQKFSLLHLNNKYLKEFLVAKAVFDYKTRVWVGKRYSLPCFEGDYVLLTPKEILTKDETWINRKEMIEQFRDIVPCIPNDVLRGQLNDYLNRSLPLEPSAAEISEAVNKTIQAYPEFIDHFIRLKEDNANGAKIQSIEKVSEIINLFVRKVEEIISSLSGTGFFDSFGDTFEEACDRVQFLKGFIENNNGYRLFYHNGKPIKKEEDLQLIFRLTWYATASDVNAEVDNGRGPVDYKISRGAIDSTLVEFKLASNTKLKQNLKHQVQVYEAANRTKKSIKVILFFSDSEHGKIVRVLKELGLNRPSFPRHLKSLTLGPTRRCHEQAAFPRRVQD